jgi:rare lipoprotein A
MLRVTFVLVGTLFTAALPVQATAQNAHHNFSGLCAYYPAHGKGYTAAHRTLPFGTRVRVSDPKTGRNVTVTIDDRGPFGKHRVLDLSPSAARSLGMISRGVIYVTAEIL